jgi:two-component system cell cycle sensor histidine kinase/response regulator CckA
MNQIKNDSDFLKTLTLLYVEDDTDTCEQLGRFLQQRVETLITAASGAAGLAAYHTHRPAIVITDIQMPEMDGLTMSMEIRKLNSTVPVIVTTAFEQTNYLLRSIEIGVDKYVIKPVDPDLLYNALLECAHRLRVEADRAELESQNRQLQKAESLGRMAGAIAHHFNNQLQTVMGNLEMAMDDLPRGENPIEILNEAMQAACKASEVSSLMLIYLGQTTALRESLDISEVCQRSLPMLRAALPKDVILEAYLSSPGTAIYANENLIRQVLINLVSNARESIHAGAMAIHLTVKPVSAAEIPASPRFPIDWLPQDNVYACIEVSDTGCGIPDKDIENIFDPFFSSKFTGRGLGLSVVLGIVRTCGGSVTVESKPGKGSIFRVFLPVTTDAVFCQLHPIATPSVTIGTPPPGKSDKTPILEGGGMVLLVEDEEPVRKMTSVMLTRLNYTVLEASDGVEAVEVFQQHQNEICCVLCDLTMPRMGGWETLAALRKISPDIPIILSSGYDKDQVMAGEHAEWPQAFLGKPYKLSDLHETIRKTIAERHLSESARLWEKIH